MSQTIFVTGGSGYIGSAIIEYAIAEGYTIRALSRSSASDAKLESLGAIPVRGDLETHDVLTLEASKASIVISLADSISGRFGTISMEERFRINNNAIYALCKGLKNTGNRLILTSGTLVSVSDPNGNETDETSPIIKDGPLAAFAHFPGTIIEQGKAEGFHVNEVRAAPWVYGRGGSGVKLFMGPASKTGQYFYINDGSANITTVHVEDLARLYLLVAKNGPSGEVYNGTSETTVTHRQLAEAIGAVLGVPVTSKTSEEVDKESGAFFSFFLSADNRASGKKAREQLGWEIKVKTGILEDVREGSYVAVAEGLKKGGN